MSETETSLKPWPVWSLSTRLFHWINFLCILGLTAAGLMLIFDDALVLPSVSKVALKMVHVYIGYIFAINLLVRFAFGNFGNRYARWGAVLPIGKGYWSNLSAYLQSIKSGKPQSWLGHNPIGRLMVALLFVLLATQAATGLILAGTDLYMPPFGEKVKLFVTNGNNELMAQLVPGDKTHVDPQSFAIMRQSREPIEETHLLVFYLIMLAALVHIGAVVLAEVREGNGMVSAMINGKKFFADKPVDAE